MLKHQDKEKVPNEAATSRGTQTNTQLDDSKSEGICKEETFQYALPYPIGFEVDVALIEQLDDLRKVRAILNALLGDNGYFECEELDRLDLIPNRPDVPEADRDLRHMSAFTLVDGYTDARALLDVLDDVVSNVNQRAKRVQTLFWHNSLTQPTPATPAK